MKSISRLVSIAAAFTIALSAVAQAAPRAERAEKIFTVEGTVLQINNIEHTLLVSDRSTSELYLIVMREGARFKITFGRYMHMAEPGFDDVSIRERVEIRCLTGAKERLAMLPDSRRAIVLTLAQ